MNAILLLNVSADVAALVQKHVGGHHQVEREPDARAGLSRIRAHPSKYDAVVIGDSVSDPVRLLQDVASVRKDLASIVLCEPNDVAELQRSMQFTPFLPSDLSIFNAAPPDAAASAIGEAAEQLARRRKYDGIVKASRGAAVAYDKVSHSHIFLKALLNDQRQPLLLLDASEQVIRWNEPASAFFGSGRPLHRRSLTDLLGDESAWMLRNDQSAQPVISVETESSASIVNASLRKLDDNGEPVGFILTLYPVQADGSVAPIGGHLELTNQALSTQADTLREMNEALLRSNRELEDFAYTASHDLQEPLRKINSFSDLLRADFGEALGGDGAFYLDRLQDASNRMIELIRGLLEYSRVTTQATPLRSTDLNVIVRRVLSDLEVALEEADASVEVHDLPSVEADPIQMRQLFQNLIGNAIKFSREGVAPRILVTQEERSSDEDAGTVTIAVRDNGIGLEMRFAERVFLPFQRLHGRTRYEGSGMGLAICKRIAQRHGGDIKVESVLGKGSVFKIRMPVRQPSSEASETSENF
jgi:signal transduction histidine kinase